MSSFLMLSGVIRNVVATFELICQVEGGINRSRPMEIHKMSSAVVRSKSEIIEGLKLTLDFRNMEDKNPLTPSEVSELLQKMADTEENAYGAALAKVFHVNGVLGLGSLVKIYPLPFSHKYSEDEKLQKKIAEFCGYFFVISGSGLRGAQAYFVDRSAIKLAQAVEVFSKLKLIS